MVVAVDQSTTVHVDGTVSLTKGTKVQLDGIPHVIVDSLPNVTVAALPAVQIAGGQSVAVSALPNVTVAALPAVQIAGGQSVTSKPADLLTANPAGWQTAQRTALNSLPALLAAQKAADDAFAATGATGADVDQVKADLLALVAAAVATLRTY